MRKLYGVILIALLILTSSVYAQRYTISGVVTEAATGEVLIGANVYIPNLAIGAATDANGEYSISVDPGTYDMTCSYIGFDRIDREVEITGDVTVNFSMLEYQFTLSVTVMSDRVKERETPVAFTNFDKKDMELNLGSQDIPLVMNTAPSVFATNQGGGAGDARFNVRGFNQRNIGVMINGIPVNDMENGWVYWSNWDGVGDATSSIQLQRGLSATTLSTPSIGGTMNIITDPSQHKAGAFFKTEMGTGSFLKQTFFGHTGMVDGKFAMSFGGIRKTGEGHADKTWTDAWAYYLGMAYEINSNNRLELYAMGAPQKHGQRRWKLNTAVFSHDLARELGYTEDVLNEPVLREKGLLYNSNVNGIDPSYYGMQWERSYWNNNVNPRRDPGYLNESENFFHKPLVNFNWYSKLSDQFSLYSTVYWSGGQGGGTGTYGSLNYDFSSLQRVVNWNSTIAENMEDALILDDPFGTGDSSTYAIATDQRDMPYHRSGILRNSVNTQWTVGAISKAYWKVNKEFTASFGLDWRTAEIDHYREVRDLLGLDFWYSYDNEFAPNGEYRQLGDKIDYYSTNSVNWVGGFVQGEYTKNQYTLYGTAGYSMVKMDYTDHFRMDEAGDKINLLVDWTGGFQLKGGFSYRATDQVHLYANGGYVSKVPIFDEVISDVDAKLVENPSNEKFWSIEGGVNASLLMNKLNLSANVYYTNWTDRTTSQIIQSGEGNEQLIRLQGISSRHMGVEVEGSWQPHRFVRFNAAFSHGIWEYTDDVSGTYIIDFAQQISEDYTFYIADLKVGDAPQTQFVAGLSIFPVPGMQAQLLWRHYDNYYSDFDPFDRTDEQEVIDNGGKAPETWQIPSYDLVEFHFAYNLPAKVVGMDLTFFAHVFNLLNELYVQDATDNSSFNGWGGDGTNHSANDAEIYPGLPTSFNIGFSAGL
ncbi:MAG: TonB-dependent receptor [Ignavibacteria bacterium]|jgi:hypothetical protein